jgi:hypothetical protein
MFKYTKSEDMLLTKELVEIFANMKASPTERELDLKRIKHLRSKVDQGLLLPFNWAVAVLNGVDYRMNGQHSSAMLKELNGAFPEGARAHIDYYEVDDNEALAMLFRQIDDRKSARSPSDVSGAYQGLVEELHEVPRKIGKLGIDGIAWYNVNVEGIPVPVGDDRYKLFDQERFHPFLKWAGGFFDVKDNDLKKPTVVAAMYGTFSKCESVEVAKSFWILVKRGGPLESDTHPATVLANWLKKIEAEKSEEHPDVRAGNLYQGCVFAWNAFRNDKTLSSIRYDTKKGLHVPAE